MSGRAVAEAIAEAFAKAFTETFVEAIAAQTGAQTRFSLIMSQYAARSAIPLCQSCKEIPDL